MEQIDETLVRSLLKTAGDESKSEDERYAALKHVCQLRGDPYVHVPLEHLRKVAAALHRVELAGWRFGPMALKDAAEAVAMGKARAAMSKRHQ